MLRNGQKRDRKMTRTMCAVRGKLGQYSVGNGKNTCE